MKNFLTLVVVLIAISIGHKAESQSMKVVYVYDALCGWCYGFSPVMQEFYDRHNDEIEFEVISGGMIKGQRIGPIGEVAGYIKYAYRDVEERTGVKFGQPFLKGVLEEGSTVFTSIPPAIAMSIFKSRKPDQALIYAKRLQEAIYSDGIDPSNDIVYGEIAAEFGLNKQRFIADMEESKYLELAKEDFQQTRLYNVRSFPTVLLVKGGLHTKISQGYVDLEKLERNFKKAKRKLQ